MIRLRRRRLSLAAVLVLLVVIGLRALNRPGGDGAAATSPRSDSRPAANHSAPSTERFIDCPVLHVVDGDTIDVEITHSVTPKERVRMLRINTPERDEPGFERATAALKALVEGRSVELRFEQPGRAERDDYGRLLAYVVVDGVDVNLELVRRGFTRFFTKYGEGRFADAYRTAEDAARADGAGLWSAEGWNVAGRDEPKPKPKRRG